MKKRLLFALAALSISFTAVAQQFHWAKSAQGVYTNVATDKAGNVYMIGYIHGGGGTVDIDPGPGITNVYSNPTMSFNYPYVIKLNKNGNFVWGYDLSSETYSFDWGLAVDDAQNVYAVGQKDADIFDPGHGGYIRKINANGSAGWQIQLGQVAVSSYTVCRDVAVDSVGNVYVSGRTSSNIDLDPGTNNVPYSNGRFIIKYTSAGDYVWHASGGSQLIEVSRDGNSIFTVEPQNASWLLPTTIRKRDGNGTEIWSRTFDSTTIKQINISEAGKIYATGYFVDTVDMDPGAGVHELMTAGDKDQFLLKLDTSGAFAWATQLGSTGIDEGAGVAYDKDGFLYTTGRFTGTVDMDPYAGVQNLVSAPANTSDIFVQKLNASTGTYLWAKPISGTFDDGTYGIAIDTAGAIFFVGASNGDVDPNTPVVTLSPGIFVAKWSDTAVLNVPQTILNNQDKVVLYPNPSTKTVNVSAEQSIDNIVVTDIAGRVMYHSTPQRRNASVDILTPGVYFINVTVGGNTSRGKVLIQ